MEMAGAMLGPGFPCLHPAIFHVLASGDVSLGALDPEDLPTIDDIPQDIFTMDLIDMISKVLIIVTLCMNIEKPIELPSAAVLHVYLIEPKLKPKTPCF